MNRFLIVLTLPVTAICIMGSVLKTDPQISLIIMIGLFLLIYLLFFKSLDTVKRKKTLFFFIFVIVSFFLIFNNSKVPEAVRVLENNNTSHRTEVTGTVVSISHINNSKDYSHNNYKDYSQNNSKDNFQNNSKEKLKIKLKDCSQITDSGKENLKGVVVYCDPFDVMIGDRIEAKGKLSLFNDAVNEGNFSERSYYESQGYFFKLYSDSSRLLKRRNDPIYFGANHIRTFFINSFDRVLPERSGVLKAVILGDKDDLDSNIKELYTSNGIAHIMAVSGLHISFFGILVYKLLKKSGFKFITSAMAGSLSAVVYSIMAGSGVSAVRAVIMVMILMLADITGRTYDKYSALCTSAIITLLITPASIYNVSFLLSYSAVLSAFMGGDIFFPYIKKLKGPGILFKGMLEGVITSLCIFFGMMPVTLYFFFEIPVYSVLLNQLVIPLSGLLMPLSIVAGIAGGINSDIGRFFAGGSDVILWIYENACLTFKGMPLFNITVGRPGVLNIIIYIIILFLAFYICTQKVKKLGTVLLIIIGTVFFAMLLLTVKPKESFYLAQIDVGQGDCIFIHTENGSNILFDCGSSDIKNVYDNRLKSFLKAKGITEIDEIYVTHSDDDHVNGIIDLMDESINKNTGIGDIFIEKIVLPDINDALKDDNYRLLEKTANEKGIELVKTRRNKKTVNGEYEVITLNPAGNNITGKDINSQSGVYKYVDHKVSILITGDIDKETEKSLVKSGADLKADILKVAHHGSNGSNSKEIIEAADPDLALISCGVNNRYGHPGDNTVRLLEEKGIKMHITSRDKGIIIRE